MADWEGEPRGAPRRRAVGLGALVLSAVLVALLAGSGDGEGDLTVSGPDGPGGSGATDDDLVVEADASPAPPDPTVPRGRWVEGDDGAPGSEPRLAWTGAEAVVLGERDGAVDGLAYDPAEGAWRGLAAAPLPAWHDPHLVAAGARVVAVSLAERPGDLAAAVLDPATGRWRPSRPAPLGDWDRLAVTSDGEEVLVVGERRSEGTTARQAGALRYHPGLDRWQALPSPPPAVRRVHAVAVLDDLLVAVVGVADAGAPAALAATAVPLGPSPRSPRGGQVGWSPPDHAPVLGRWTPGALARPERGDVVVSGPARSGTSRLAGAAWTPWRGWRSLGSGDGAPPLTAPTLTGVDGGVLAWWAGAPTRVHAEDEPGWWPLGVTALDAREGVAAVDADGHPLVVDAAGALWVPEALAVPSHEGSGRDGGSDVP